MTLDNSKKILIVGLGLLGGSYAMALKKKGFRVTAITRSRESIDYALAHSLIDEGDTAVNPDLIEEADIIVFALYPQIFKDWITENGHRKSINDCCKYLAIG